MFFNRFLFVFLVVYIVTLFSCTDFFHGSLVDVELTNSTTMDVFEVHTRRNTSDQWGSDLIGARIGPGSKRTITGLEKAVYDFQFLMVPAGAVDASAAEEHVLLAVNLKDYEAFELSIVYK